MIKQLKPDGKLLNIGVLMFRDTSVNGVPVFGCNKAYLEYASLFGNVEMINPTSSHIREDIDVLILPGGEDVYQGHFHNEAPSFYQQRPNPFFTWWFRNMYPLYEKKGIPTLAICMSMQALGQLDGVRINPHYPIPVSMPRDKEIDTLINQSSRPLKNIYNTSFKVNSIHHQSFWPEAFDGTDWEVLAVSKEYDNVEIIRKNNILAVQYHPEELNCQTTAKMFYDIINNAYNNISSPILSF